MKIANDIKVFVQHPNEFIKINPKRTFLFSTALKILAFSLLIFETFYPHFFTIASLLIFSSSFFLDYKMFSNAEDVMFSLFQSSVNANPYKTGYYLGRVSGIVIKAHFWQRLSGFFSGFKKEFFN